MLGFQGVRRGLVLSQGGNYFDPATYRGRRGNWGEDIGGKKDSQTCNSVRESSELIDHILARALTMCGPDLSPRPAPPRDPSLITVIGLVCEVWIAFFTCPKRLRYQRLFKAPRFPHNTSPSRHSLQALLSPKTPHRSGLSRRAHPMRGATSGSGNYSASRRRRYVGTISVFDMLTFPSVLASHFEHGQRLPRISVGSLLIP